MKILVTGLQRKQLIAYIEENYAGFEVTEDDPEVIISYGGDGSLLYAERHYPGVPKVMLRNSQVCNLCATVSRDTVLQLLQDHNFDIQEYTKLQLEANGNTRIALNDVVVGHPHVNGTLRAKISIDGKQYGNEILGDGVVVSTPLGSTGYYQSITRSNFQFGLGVAFNNTVRTVSHLVLDENTAIQVEVTRGPGRVAADNDEDQIELSTGDTVQIAKARENAKIVHFPTEHQRFNLTSQTNRVPLGSCQICKRPYDQ